MDFGFSPGGDAHTRDLRAMFARQANTTLIDGAAVATVQQLISHVDKNPKITKPIGDFLLGMHSNDEGQLFILMFPGQNGPTVFETLEESLKKSAKSIKIPDALIGFKTGNPATHAVHVKGCNIGLAQPFLLKLKEALGGNVKVTAPKFFHGATPAKQGLLEYMGYQFAVKRPKPFPDLKTALSEFDAAQFPLIDGTIVPTKDWEKLIPGNPNTPRAQQIDSKLGITLEKRTTIRTPRQYRAIQIAFGPWTVPFPDAASVPKDESGQLSALESHLKTDPRFKDTHPFPQFKREGFDRVIEFVSGYTWNCRPRGASLVCNGLRMLYVIVLAVTDPKTTPPKGLFCDGNLIFNFYPNAKSTLTPITTGFTVADPKFFATV
jgi:hypothetical protein